MRHTVPRVGSDARPSSSPIRDRAGRTVAAQGRYINGEVPKTRTADPKRGVCATPGLFDADVVAIVEAPLCALSLAGSSLPAVRVRQLA